MTPPPFSRRFLINQWAFAALHSLLVCMLILFHKTASATPFYLEVSFSRLLTIAAPFSVLLFSLYSIRLSRLQAANPIIQHIFSSKSRIMVSKIFAAIAISIGLAGVCLPAYHFQSLAAYYVRLQPLFAWVGVCGLQLLTLLFFPDRQMIQGRLNGFLTKDRSALILAFWILLIFILTWIFISLTRTGISGDEDFWYEAGVPILPAQVLVSVLAGILFILIENMLPPVHLKNLDKWTFVVIWAMAALFWAFTPATNSYFNPGPLPPNHEFYPYSDAAKYDLQSQYALIGLGLDNGRSIDNPLYPAFLAFIHSVTGQNYTVNMALQAAIFAVFPAIVYLLAKNLFGGGTGMTAATMVVFRGYNSIAAASFINLAGPKQMLTDFPTAIGVALGLLTLFSIFNKEEVHPMQALWHGGAIGFSFLIRPTTLVLLAVTPAIAVMQRFPPKKWLKVTILIFTGFAVFITPWGIRNDLVGRGAIATYLNKVALIGKERFPEIKENRTEWSSGNASEQPQADADPGKEAWPSSFTTVSKILFNHFLHNIIGSILILPTTLSFDNLQHTIRQPESIWLASWEGALTPTQTVVLLASLVVLALGIATAWKNKKLVGLSPLIVFLLYQLANSAGRTSGGRFIVPVDWIIICYFSIGMIKISTLLLETRGGKTDVQVVKTDSISREAVFTLLLILLLGSAPLAVELPFTEDPQSMSVEAILADPNFQAALSQSSYTEKDILRFLEGRGAVLLAGQAMYPRYFSQNALAHNTEGGIKGAGFPHLEFHLMLPRGVQPVVLYILKVSRFSNNSSVFVMGCEQKGTPYIDAIAVIQNSAETAIHVRESNPVLECPLEPPVCDNNGNCQ